MCVSLASLAVSAPFLSSSSTIPLSPPSAAVCRTVVSSSPPTDAADTSAPASSSTMAVSAQPALTPSCKAVLPQSSAAPGDAPDASAARTASGDAVLHALINASSASLFWAAPRRVVEREKGGGAALLPAWCRGRHGNDAAVCLPRWRGAWAPNGGANAGEGESVDNGDTPAFFWGEFLTGVQSNRVLLRLRLRRPQGECIGSRDGDHPEDRSFITLTSKLKQGEKKPERGSVPQHVTRVGPGGVTRKFLEQVWWCGSMFWFESGLRFPPPRCVSKIFKAVTIEPIVENLKKSRYQNWTS